jgi:hypothetical protein
MITQEIVAEKLLWPLWRCVTDDYKSRYKRDVWDHFENAVRAAAYTGNLRTYLANFQARIPCELQAQFMRSIKQVVDAACDAEILDWLRDETTYMVMLVRLMNQDRREAFEESQSGFNDFNPETFNLEF